MSTLGPVFPTSSSIRSCLLFAHGLSKSGCFQTCRAGSYHGVSVGRKEAFYSALIRSQSFGKPVLQDCELYPRFCFSFLTLGGIS